VLGDAFVSDRRLTLIPIDDPEPPSGSRPARTPAPTATPDPTPTPSATADPTPTPGPSATPTADPTPREPKPPDRQVPDPRALDPQGPPPDRAAPELDLPAGIAARASDRRGARVRYPMRAADAVDGAVTPSCSPASGSRFPIGTTTVRCTARDRAGNTNTGSFKVRVSPPAPPTPTPTPRVTPPAPEPDPKAPEEPQRPTVPEVPQQKPDKPPVFTGPTDIVVETGRLPGTMISYPTPPATDDHDPDVAVKCNPPKVAAGSSADVTCTATDDAGLSTEQGFVVTVKTLG
jgi:hypothetical protein